MTRARDLARLLVSAGGQLADANAPSGSVIQAVTATFTGTNSLGSGGGNNTWYDVGLSGSITPRSVNSKILVLIDAAFGQSESTQEHNIRLVRDGTVINTGSGGTYNTTRTFGGAGWTSSVGWASAITVLDSPSSTSAVTYKLQWSNNQGTMTFNIGSDNSHKFESRIVLLEVAA